LATKSDFDFLFWKKAIFFDFSREIRYAEQDN